MADARLVVLHASVGVKWFKHEAGSEMALDLLAQAAAGEIVLVADHLFLYEVLSVLHRRFGSAFTARAHRSLLDAQIALVAPDQPLVDAALRQADSLDCDLYDAFSAALAEVLGAPLFSADRKAHEGFGEVVLV